jgi:hypothetical protein
MNELADWMGIAAGSRSNTAVVGAGGKTTTRLALVRSSLDLVIGRS